MLINSTTDIIKTQLGLQFRSYSEGKDPRHWFYFVAGQLTSGTHVNLHLWLTAQTENDTTIIQGFGTFESLDPMEFSGQSGHTATPHQAMIELLEPGMLFLEVPSDKTQIVAKARNGFSPPIPFHLECRINTSQVKGFAPLPFLIWCLSFTLCCAVP